MKVGFIGGGNMASAMIGGMIQKGVVSADDILVSVRTEKSVERLTNQFGCLLYTSPSPRDTR